MTQRTHEQLTEDLRQLNDFLRENRHELTERGILTPLLAMASRAEAKLDADKLLPVPGADRRGDAYRLIARAWMRINSKAITGKEYHPQRE